MKTFLCIWEQRCNCLGQRRRPLTVTATTDDDGVLTYSLGGPDAASFSIVPETRASCRPRRSWTKRRKTPTR